MYGYKYIYMCEKIKSISNIYIYIWLYVFGGFKAFNGSRGASNHIPESYPPCKDFSQKVKKMISCIFIYLSIYLSVYLNINVNMKIDK